MASFTLKNEQVFPVGTVVTAYLRSNWPTWALPPAGAPRGSAAASGTVAADGSVTLSGLADATNYFAYAASPDRYISFRTPVAAAAGAAPALNVTDAKFARMRPTGAITETFPRSTGLANGASLSSGILRLNTLMYFAAGVPATALSAISGGTALATPTNQWFCVVRQSDLTVLAVTADDLTAAWATNAVKTLAIAGGPWTPAQDEWCYFGIMVAATTVPSLYCQSMANGTVAGLGNVMCANSTSGLTTPLAVGTVVTVGATGTFNAYGYAT